MSGPGAGEYVTACPVWLGMPAAHPWIASVLRHVREMATFGPGVADGASARLRAAIMVVEDETAALRAHLARIARAKED